MLNQHDLQIKDVSSQLTCAYMNMYKYAYIVFQIFKTSPSNVLVLRSSIYIYIVEPHLPPLDVTLCPLQKKLQMTVQHTCSSPALGLLFDFPRGDHAIIDNSHHPLHSPRHKNTLLPFPWCGADLLLFLPLEIVFISIPIPTLSAVVPPVRESYIAALHTQFSCTYYTRYTSPRILRTPPCLPNNNLLGLRPFSFTLGKCLEFDPIQFSILVHFQYWLSFPSQEPDPTTKSRAVPIYATTVCPRPSFPCSPWSSPQLPRYVCWYIYI